MRGKRVLVVDSDPQGNATTGLGIDKTRLTHDVYHALLQEVPLERRRRADRNRELSTAFPQRSTSPAPTSNSSPRCRAKRVCAKRSRRSRRDTISCCIDSPPSLGLLTINALTAADECIIPVQAEFYALEGLAQLTNVIWRVRDALNPTLHVSGVLVTMFDGRTRLAMEVLDELEKLLPAADVQDADSAQRPPLRSAVVRQAGRSSST